MNIDYLQIKRVKGNWEKHKTYTPEDGELVLIDIPGLMVPSNPGTNSNKPAVDVEVPRCLVVGCYKKDANDNYTSTLCTLEELVWGLIGGSGTKDYWGSAIPSRERVVDMLNESIDAISPNKTNPINPESIISNTTYYNTPPYTQVNTSSPGTSEKFAREDHKHSISRITVQNALDVNTGIDSESKVGNIPTGLFTCRRIMFGTKSPTENDTIKFLTDSTYNGDKNEKPHPGDIYIRYKNE